MAAARISRSSFVDRGVHTVSLRFAPTVHGAGDHGFIATIAAVARQKGVSGYPGDGTNRWAAVHRSDAGHLVALGLAKAPAGARLHAVAEVGIPTRDIAEAIGRAFSLPVTSIAPDDIEGHFGWIGTFFGMDLAATSTVTRELLGLGTRRPDSHREPRRRRVLAAHVDGRVRGDLWPRGRRPGIARQAEEALGDDVQVDLVRSAVDGLGAAEQVGALERV